MRRRLLIAGWTVILCLSALLPLSAIFHGIVHVGPGAVTVDPHRRTPVLSLGGNVRLPRGSGSVVVVLFGDVWAHGTVGDDVVTARGRIYLEPHTRVMGDIVSVLGGIYRAPGVSMTGRVGGALHVWNGRSPEPSRAFLPFLLSTMRLGMAAGLALLLIGTCLTVVFPWQIVLISSTLRGSPVKSTAAGLLSLLTFLFLVVPLGLSLAGLPFALLLTGAAILAWLFGITAASVVLGRALARNPASLLWAAGAGLIALALGMSVPVAGPLIVLLLGLAGAGALAVALLGRGSPVVPVA